MIIILNSWLILEAKSETRRSFKRETKKLKKQEDDINRMRM